MTLEFKRTDRIAELIQRKLAQIIQQEIKDPRMSAFITLTSVTVTKDLKQATVYFTVLKADPLETKEILTTAASYLRSVLARSIQLRATPQLRFVYDESVEYGRKLSKLIDDVTTDDDSVS
ncbi:MAG: ribosome-binding factor A [Legionellaceae bacterium]|nr:ribosome-binding factor A [Legionellaceae bacterium]|tara:strand:- start:1561 stop:1923 length:363 start_codon:yes stop_codon:yes gene_type:complete